MVSMDKQHRLIPSDSLRLRSSEPNRPFKRRSESSIPLKLADRLSDTQKARIVAALVEKYGSRRALIEELDRRRRLALLKPDNRVNTKEIGNNGKPGNNPKIRNEPNPQWREITTPSLLFEGEKREDFTLPGPDLTEALKESHPEKKRKPTPKQKKARWERLPTVKVKRYTSTCKGCNCDLDDYTKNCPTCATRHGARRKALERKGVLK